MPTRKGKHAERGYRKVSRREEGEKPGRNVYVGTAMATCAYMSKRNSRMIIL